ncbi:hypothetical protein [Bifidobacterium simiiventris]|uniref:hypothetical protein n=1 Tax=Bifidobacterium simiiventris TaxID=2834434 RepID=UPI001C59747C|nr:hypothetical protein [Bifidobacterium simiiventris]MBW3077965.1 hypothetical protein [Bifidobacterium simiiventris]
MIDLRKASAAALGVILAASIAACGPAQQQSQTDGDVAASCAVSYAKTYDSPQDYIDDIAPDLVAKATFGDPTLSGNGRTISFTAHLLDVKRGNARSGDDVKLRFTCDSVTSFMPDGYRTGDEVIVLASDGLLRQPGSVWPFDRQTYDSLTVR